MIIILLETLCCLDTSKIDLCTVHYLHTLLSRHHLCQAKSGFKFLSYFCIWAQIYVSLACKSLIPSPNGGVNTLSECIAPCCNHLTHPYFHAIPFCSMGERAWEESQHCMQTEPLVFMNVKNPRPSSQSALLTILRGLGRPCDRTVR